MPTLSRRNPNTILTDVDRTLQTINTLSILSFNTRVEAARADETKSGFIVVRAEMKRRADETDKLAKQISTKVKSRLPLLLEMPECDRAPKPSPHRP